MRAGPGLASSGCVQDFRTSRMTTAALPVMLRKGLEVWISVSRL
jgi:hypothetical protein